jgi:hypothetical protein
MSTDVAERPKKLPAQFADLQPWDEWILFSDRERVDKQVSSDVEDLAMFYNAVAPRAAELYDYLDGVRLDEPISDENLALLTLAIAFAEIADGVEFYAPDSTAPVDMPRWVTSHDSIFGGFS